ncbi:hypothetical protein PIB30_084365 [Stylosanthes scabra]|uniref:Uncharacterized protein n=1 Tax=Stylosanthes scabra TaxID=79078 RepID=A0ABU6SSR4_9FABA|nr:hypothetical protein [Stylosanthes scabra]
MYVLALKGKISPKLLTAFSSSLTSQVRLRSYGVSDEIEAIADALKESLGRPSDFSSDYIARNFVALSAGYDEMRF